MAIYRIELVASAEQHERLLADPASFGIPDEVTLAASATGFTLHLAWPQNRTVNLIVEGDSDPGELTETMFERLAGGWEPRWARIEAAGEFVGGHSAWVARMVLELELAICDSCGWVVPPHGPGCVFEKRDEGHERARISIRVEVEPDVNRARPAAGKARAIQESDGARAK